MAKKALIIAGWLAAWQLASLLFGNPLLFAGPWQTLVSLARHLPQASFWAAIGFTFTRIAAGFLAAFVLAVAAAVLAWRFRLLGEVLAPAVAFVKSVPVVSIIVLLLVWVGSRHVSMIAVGLMVFPPIYYAVLEGMRQASRDMIEMLDVFGVPRLRRARFFFLPLVLPYLVAALQVAIGVAWKSGVAAEVIGVPDGSIGEGIYFGKISLETADVFAWTFVTVALAIASERAVLAAVGAAARAVSSRSPALAGLPAPVKDDGSGHDGSACDEGGHGERTRTSGRRLCLELRGVSVDYGRGPVLEDFDLRLEAGERVCVMGPSGIGKTTLLDVASGLRAPDSGTARRPERVARVFQEDRLIGQLSAWDNVRLVAAGGEAEAQQWKQELDALLGADSAQLRPAEMSGGMKRKAALVRALAAPGGMVVLDEPFAGMDAESHQAAAALVGRAAAGLVPRAESGLVDGAESGLVDRPASGLVDGAACGLVDGAAGGPVSHAHATRAGLGPAKRAILLATHDPADAELLGARVVRICPTTQADCRFQGKSGPQMPPFALKTAIKRRGTCRVRSTGVQGAEHGACRVRSGEGTRSLLASSRKAGELTA